MKKILFAILVTLVSFTTSFAVETTRYKSGCFEIHADGSAYFKTDYKGWPGTPADQELWIDNGGSLIGPYMPDYTTGMGTANWTNHYLLPAGTFSTPGPDCIDIQEMKDIHPTEIDEYRHRICRCGCDLEFRFIQYSSNNAASIVPSSPCSDCEYGFDYGTGEPVVWGEPFSHEYSTSGTYTVCLWMKETVEGKEKECVKCKDFCIKVSEEEGGDVEYPHPDGLWKGNQGEDRQYKDAGKMFHVFPNPSNGSITISGQLARQAGITVRVANTLGQEVLKQDFSAGQGSFKHALSLDKLSNGVYTVTISADGKEETHRVSVAQ